MDLCKTKNGILTSSDLEEKLFNLNLSGKNVLIYSRLLGIGRFLGKDAIIEFIRVMQNSIGKEGTLIIPAYTLNTYKEPREFDYDRSKIMSGVLGEIAATLPDFKRTVHPVYSNCIAGPLTERLLAQNTTTCFGTNSFFDLFSQLDNAIVLMVGLNFNGPTLYHYYEQKFKAQGRFVKSFDVKMTLGEYIFMNKFDSYVKDYGYYHEKTNCLAKFDALAEQFNLVSRIRVGDDFIHMISEKEFQLFYKAALKVDQEYLLMGTQTEWEEYYLKNKFDLYHGKIKPDIIKKMSSETGYKAVQ